MTQRFQIEDLISQDASCVVFRAIDKETNALVDVRRIFPFGVDCGGLIDEEQTAYTIAVARLVGLHHPNMRSVICGGCDPIDGMPFIATECVLGKPLSTFIEDQPLTPTGAINVITRALEVSEMLSQVLAEEAIWVETDLRTIIVGDEGSGRGVTFWTSPAKWLRRKEEPGNLDSIIVLTEEIMGWKGQTVGDNVARGLGGWLKWLKRASKTTSLAEAREMLAASSGMEPPTPGKNLVRQAATRPTGPVAPAAPAAPAAPVLPIAAAKPRKKSINGIVVTIVLLCLAAGGLVTWAIYRNDPHKPKESLGLAELAAQMERENAKNSTKTPAPTPALPEAAPDKSSDSLFSFNDPEILRQDGKNITVEGVLAKLEPSKDGKTLQVFFSRRPSSTEVRGAIVISQAGPDLTEESLKPLIGQTVRLSGIVKTIQKSKTSKHPEITLANRAAIKEIQ